MSLLVCLGLLTPFPANAAEVVVSQQRVLSLQPPRPPEAAPPAPFVGERELALWVEDEGVRFDATWSVHAPAAGWLDTDVAAAAVHLESVTLDGRQAAVSTEEGMHRLAARLPAGTARIRATGVVDGQVARGVDIALRGASGPVQLRGAAHLEGAIPLGDGEFWSTGAPLRLVPLSADGDDAERLVLGQAAVGVTVADDAIAIQARLRWRAARGELGAISVELPGAGPDLEITGPTLARWERQGDTVRVELVSDDATAVDLMARYTSPLPTGDEARVRLGAPSLGGAFRTTHALQVARDTQVEIVPEVGELQAVAASRLPSWATGLVRGANVAAFLGDAREPRALQLYRLTPASQPPTLIDVAQYTMATSEDGHVLLRAHYAVRNDRGAVLRVTPPPGLQVVAVRVAGETARVAREGADTLIPLVKSVETVEGLLTFPIEVAFLGRTERWSRREQRSVPLPRVDVDIAVARATLHLPPRYRSRAKVGRTGVVEDFTEGQGITYGFALGDVRAAQADALFQQAVGAWMDNSFEQAQTLVTELDQLGADNEDVQRLKSNLEVVLEGKESGNVAQARRVREQAWARAAEDVVRQRSILDEAERSYSSGDYDKAEAAYKEALDIGENLVKLTSDVDEVSQENTVLLEKIASSQRVRAEKRAAEEVSRRKQKEPPPAPAIVEEPEPEPESAVASAPPPDPPPPDVIAGEFVMEVELEEGEELAVFEEGELAVITQDRLEIRFDDVEITGELSKPSGQLLLDRDPFADDDLAPSDTKDFPPVQVTASTVSVVVPSIGEPVRYQRLLLPAGGADAVPVRARRKRRAR
ncbi:MAG: hypothetical protein KTR31_39840 [Myxococcales bacterium]|nr:hypothetical protein [Myxococcales bacterium]